MRKWRGAFIPPVRAGHLRRGGFTDAPTREITAAVFAAAFSIRLYERERESIVSARQMCQVVKKRRAGRDVYRYAAVKLRL